MVKLRLLWRPEQPSVPEIFLVLDDNFVKYFEPISFLSRLVFFNVYIAFWETNFRYCAQHVNISKPMGQFKDFSRIVHFDGGSFKLLC